MADGGGGEDKGSDGVGGEGPMQPINQPASRSIKRSPLLAAVVCAQLSACSSMVENLPPGMRFSSVYRSVNTLLEKNDFDAARAKLDEAGVGAIPSADKLRDRDSAAARRSFETKATEHFIQEQKDLLAAGRPRRANERLAYAATICSWCNELDKAKGSAASLVAKLDAYGSLVHTRAQSAGDIVEDRATLGEAAPYKNLLNDSPAIQRDIDVVQEHVADTWATRVRTDEVSRSDVDQFKNDLLLLDLDSTAAQRLETEFELSRLGASQLLDKKESREALLALTRTPAPVYPKQSRGLHDALRLKLGEQMRTALRIKLLDRSVDYASLSFGEELLAASQNRVPELRDLVAQAHLTRAERFAGTGVSAVLALLHSARAYELGAAGTKQMASEVRSTAKASFSAAGRSVVTVRIQTNPSDDPIVQDLARYAVMQAISEHARPHVRLQPVSMYQKHADIDISLDSTRMFVPSPADLSAQNSTYLSHFEQVPNPAKARLRQQLNYQNIEVDSALSNLNYAISTFNIAPSDWALQNVNNARTQYSMAVDQYNNLVNIYNATSSTVSQPVYLPYVFRQGTVRHGWQITGSVHAGTKVKEFSVEQVDSDFVRLGTRPDDRNASYRRDDLLDIQVGTDRLIEQLIKAAGEIEEKVAEASKGLVFHVAVALSAEEHEIVNASLYPFSNERLFSLPKWADEAMRKVALPEISDRAAPTVRVLAPSAHARSGTPEDLATFYGPLVALISNKDGSIGSGALISGDGLVLTAAHVLSAEPYEVTFPRSSDKRRWIARVVFVNEVHDVALLRIADYRSERWFDIALSAAAVPGEPVVAIGNPAIRGAPSVNTISSGIVAKPYDPTRSGIADLVADIAVASGSSGGPLISRKTGKLVGVVTAVVAPSITQDFASSGYWAVAAPSTELGKWLGLRYE